jgi:large subunit ribosomal protein L13
MLTKTTSIAKPENIDRKWYIVDAEGLTLGRMATQVATVLRGKNKPCFTPFIDTGDFVIVINADKIVLTGNKAEQKFYYTHSGYPGGFKAVQYKHLMEKKPVFVVEKAIKGMLPKNKLGRAMSKKLKVYAGSEHPHAAQKPEKLEIKA